jgi:GT2 family glycosyltransferase
MLSTVIVNWNLKDDTVTCIDSLIKAGASSRNIILIDNGSTDGSVDTFNAHFGNDVHLITNGTNLGYTFALNQGIQYALDQNSDWILILNNDTVVAQDLFQQVNKYLYESNTFSIIAPLILYHAQPDRIWFLGDYIIRGTLITYNSYRNKKIPDNLPDFIPVDFLTGCAMFVKREVFDQIGLFDDTFVMYGEEVDFCWRARLAGHRLGCVTKARIWHKVSLSAGKVKPQTRYYRIRNQILFYRKYAHGVQRSMMFIFTIIRSIMMLIKDILQRQTELISPLFKGWKDGWKA